MKGKYTKRQLDYIILLLALRTPDTKILSDYRMKYLGSEIFGEDLDEIKEVYENEIKETAKKELSDNNAVACAFSRVRLEIINRGIIDCLTPKFLGSSPITKEAEGDRPPYTYYQEKVGMDIPNLVKLIDLAQKEDFFARKLRLEKLTRGITSSDPVLDGPGTPTVTIYTGYDSEEQKLLVDSAPEEALEIEVDDAKD